MRVVVIGSGGQGKVVVDTCRAAGWTVLGTADSDPHSTIDGLPHLGSPDNLQLEPDVRAVVAIGSNNTRHDIAQRLEGRVRWASVVHPAATVSPTAHVEEGAVIFAGAIVQAGAVVKRHVILNTGSMAEHDSIIGDFCHVAPGAVVGGRATIGEGVLIGIGAIIVPDLTLGEWGIIGAGGVVLQDTKPGVSYFGVPAKPLPGSRTTRKLNDVEDA